VRIVGKNFESNFIKMHGVYYSVKVGNEMRFHLLIKGMAASSMSTAAIYPIRIYVFALYVWLQNSELWVNRKFGHIISL
jgi:hypothetical protein